MDASSRRSRVLWDRAVAEDIAAHTQLCTGTVTQRQHVPFSKSCTKDMLREFLEQVFDGVTEGEDRQGRTFLTVYESVRVTLEPDNGRLQLEWEANPMSDELRRRSESIYVSALTPTLNDIF